MNDPVKRTRRFQLEDFLFVGLVLVIPIGMVFSGYFREIYRIGLEKYQEINHNWTRLNPFAGDPEEKPEAEASAPSSPDPVSSPEPQVSERPPPTSKWDWCSFLRTRPQSPSPPSEIPSRFPARNPYPIPQRLTLSHIEGNNFTNCFATNYTKAQFLLAAEYVPGKFLPQFDLRADRFDDTTYAACGGLIVRYIPKKDGPVKRIFGFNGYYDYRQGNVGYFNQFGGGIEILSKRWDFRANVYVPFGRKRKMQHCVFDNYVGDFSAVKDTFESVSFAYNAEVGWLAINSKHLLLYLAGGPYYIAGRKCFDKTRGGEFRVQPQYKDYLALNAIVSHDPLFNTVYQFEVILNLPFYLLSKKIDKKETCGLTPRQIYQPVIRYDVMPIGRCTCWMFNWDDVAP